MHSLAKQPLNPARLLPLGRANPAAANLQPAPPLIHPARIALLITVPSRLLLSFAFQSGCCLLSCKSAGNKARKVRGSYARQRRGGGGEAAAAGGGSPHHLQLMPYGAACCDLALVVLRAALTCTSCAICDEISCGSRRQTTGGPEISPAASPGRPGAASCTY